MPASPRQSAIGVEGDDDVEVTGDAETGFVVKPSEGTTLESMVNGDSKLGDGTKWKPTIKVKGGVSGFYQIKVTK